MKVVRLRGREVEGSLEIPTLGPQGRGALVGRLAEAIESLSGRKTTQGGGSPPGRLRHRADRGVCAVGVAVPGFLDERRGTVLRLSNVPELNGVPLRRALERRLDLPVLLDTDTNAGAVGEAVLGAGQGFDRVLYLTIGTGLGAALVVRGEPVRVSRHTVGQVAHIPLEADGPRCSCGARGCAEAVLCARGILWRARRFGVRSVGSTKALWEAAAGESLSSRSARVRSLRLWQDVGRLLGQLCVILGALFSPQATIVGGGVSGASSGFLPAAREYLRRHLERRLGSSAVLKPAARAPLSGALGAAILARRAVDRGAPALS